MGPWAVAFMFSLGASAWVYTKIQKRSGASNPKQTFYATSVVFIFLLFVSYYIFNIFL